MQRFIIASCVALAFLASPVRLCADDNEHPRIEHAIHELEETIHMLENADHDFGGHREQAIASCREAIHRLREAMEFAHHRIP
jgi:hypothetical protein